MDRSTQLRQFQQHGSGNMLNALGGFQANSTGSGHQILNIGLAPKPSADETSASTPQGISAIITVGVQPETTPSPCSTIPFLRDRDFVERGTILNQINKKTAPGYWAALVGLGGVGKSQLAIEYGYRVRFQSPETWVFWVYASNSTRFEESYREIANRAKIPGRDMSDNILKLVYNWLCSQSGKWLIILDNADNADILRKRSNGMGLIEYIPKGQNGSVLITSRSRVAALQLVGESDIIAVEPMDEAHAVSLLTNKLRTTGDNKSLTKLVAMLEFMPLAITQAAAFISHRVPRFSVEQYLEKFQESESRKINLLSYEEGQSRRDNDATNSIITTWQISFDYIQETRPSAADLLSFMSFFDRQEIPESMLCLYRKGMGRDEAISGDDNTKEGGSVSSMPELSEDEGFESDLQTLMSYSFISVGTDPTVFEMHRLVQLATRIWLKAHGSLETWKQQYIRQLSAQFPPRAEYETWATCQVLFPHAKLALELEPENKEYIREWASLLMHAADYAGEKGNSADAMALSAKGVEVCKRELGKDHELTLEGMFVLSRSYFLAGDWTKARELGEEVAEKMKQLLGMEDDRTLTSLTSLAQTYNFLGRIAEAEEMLVPVLEISKRVRGEEDLKTVHIMHIVAVTYADQSRWKEAEELVMKVLEIRRRDLGMEHPRTLAAMEHLASVHFYLGRHKEAEELQKQILEISTRIIGLEHPETLATMFNLSCTYFRQRRQKEWEELVLKELELSKKVLGIEHPDTWNSMTNMAVVYVEQMRYDEAEELLVQVLEPSENKLGAAHPDTLNIMHNLAITWGKQGKLPKAIDLMRKCVQLRVEHLGPAHPDTLNSSRSLDHWRREMSSLRFLVRKWFGGKTSDEEEGNP